MGTYSWKYTYLSTNDSTAYLDITMPSVTLSAATLSYTFPTAKVRTQPTGSGMGSRYYYALSIMVYNGSTKLFEKVYGNSNTVANGTTWASLTGGAGGTIYTSSLFTSSNKTSKTVTLTVKTGGYLGMDPDWGTFFPYAEPDASAGTFTVTLNAPPTFNETFSYVGDFSGVPYAGLTTAKVKLSSLSAKYGGDFSGVGKAEFTIGSQTVSKANPANNDELSIPLNAVGTFTPTVKITDSRGQVTTHTLNAITVQGYVAPSVNFSVERTLSTGVPDDEGESATITATFIFTDAIATLSAPTISVTDDDGVTQTVSTTWYSTRASDGTLSGSVDWSSLSSGDTVYGLVSITGDFNTQKSYQIAITPQDSEGTGTTVTQTLGSAFYTVDFYAGGHGIAFGQPASQDGFFCNMDAHFVDKSDVMRALFDFIHPVGSYYETSDTTFNPNTTWGGTWVLETEGLVHISAGTNYAVNGAPTDTQDGGSPTSATNNHTLTLTEIPSHNHNSKTLTGTFRVMAWSSTTVSGIVTKSNQDKNRNPGSGSNEGACTYTINATHTHDSQGGGGAHNHGNVSTMQPFIIVNRWHRIA